MDYKAEIQSLVAKVKAQGYEAICFYSPAYNTGGGTQMYCNMAKYLSKNTDLEVCYFDYAEGFATRLLEGENVRFFEYKDEDIVFPQGKKCIIFTNSTRAILLKRMRPDNRLIFWHYETVPCAWQVVFIQNEAKEFLRICNEKKAMVFHDWSGWDILSQNCGKEYEKHYFPLCLPPKKRRDSPQLKSKSEINLAWIGRLVPDKNYSLFNIIDNFAKYQTERKKIVHIIGDGRNRADVERYCMKYQKKIQFHIRGTISKDKLDDYLLENADITFGMGLSALEGAALGIPSVVVKLDTKRIQGDEFFWLFDTKEFCAGILPSQRERFDIQYSTFEQIMDQLYVFGQRAVMGEKCLRYYLENLSDMEYAIYSFLKALAADTMTMADLEACIRYIPYNHIKAQKRMILGKTISSKIIAE